MKKYFILTVVFFMCFTVLGGSKAYAKKSKEVIKGNVLKEYSGNDKCYTVPKTVKKISKNAFAKAKNLKKVVITENVKEIDSAAFYGADKVSAIDVDKKNKRYDSYKGALYSEKLKELIIIPPGMKKLVPYKTCKISDECFEFLSLPKLESLTIGAKWDIKGEVRWPVSDRLKEIKVQKGNKIFYVEDGSLFRKESNGTVSLMLYCSKESGPVNEYTVPANVSVIAGNAFSGANIKKIILPDSINEISMGAFSGCKVECVQIDNRNRSGNFWSAYMFDGCPELKKAVFTQNDTIMPGNGTAIPGGGNIFRKDVVIYSRANSTAKSYADAYGYQWCELF